MNTPKILNLDELVSMTSVEIAELTGKRHDHVLRDVRKMSEGLPKSGESSGITEDTYQNAQGKEQPLFVLNRKRVFMLLARYSYEFSEVVFNRLEALERRVLELEEQQTRAAKQSANRRGVTWGDYCKAAGLPAQKLMTILKKERKLLSVHPISGEWSVNPRYADYFRVIGHRDQWFNLSGINIRLNAAGIEFFSKPENVLKFTGKVIAKHGTDKDKQAYQMELAALGASL